MLNVIAIAVLAASQVQALTIEKKLLGFTDASWEVSSATAPAVVRILKIDVVEDEEGLSTVRMAVRFDHQSPTMTQMCLAIDLFAKDMGGLTTAYGQLGVITRGVSRRVLMAAQVRSKKSIQFYRARFIECEIANRRDDRIGANLDERGLVLHTIEYNFPSRSPN